MSPRYTVVFLALADQSRAVSAPRSIRPSVARLQVVSSLKGILQLPPRDDTKSGQAAAKLFEEEVVEGCAELRSHPATALSQLFPPFRRGACCLTEAARLLAGSRAQWFFRLGYARPPIGDRPGIPGGATFVTTVGHADDRRLLGSSRVLVRRKKAMARARQKPSRCVRGDLNPSP